MSRITRKNSIVKARKNTFHIKFINGQLKLIKTPFKNKTIKNQLENKIIFKRTVNKKNLINNKKDKLLTKKLSIKQKKIPKSNPSH